MTLAATKSLARQALDDESENRNKLDRGERLYTERRLEEIEYDIDDLSPQVSDSDLRQLEARMERLMEFAIREMKKEIVRELRADIVAIETASTRGAIGYCAQVDGLKDTIITFATKVDADSTDTGGDSDYLTKIREKLI